MLFKILQSYLIVRVLSMLADDVTKDNPRKEEVHHSPYEPHHLRDRYNDEHYARSYGNNLQRVHNYAEEYNRNRGRNTNYHRTLNLTTL